MLVVLEVYILVTGAARGHSEPLQADCTLIRGASIRIDTASLQPTSISSRTARKASQRCPPLRTRHVQQPYHDKESDSHTCVPVLALLRQAFTLRLQGMALGLERYILLQQGLVLLLPLEHERDDIVVLDAHQT